MGDPARTVEDARPRASRRHPARRVVLAVAGRYVDVRELLLQTPGQVLDTTVLRGVVARQDQRPALGLGRKKSWTRSSAGGRISADARAASVNSSPPAPHGYCPWVCALMILLPRNTEHQGRPVLPEEAVDGRDRRARCLVGHWQPQRLHPAGQVTLGAPQKQLTARLTLSVSKPADSVLSCLHAASVQQRRVAWASSPAPALARFGQGRVGCPRRPARHQEWITDSREVTHGSPGLLPQARWHRR